ncbi:MAG: GNAT family N-acetyltransferase [Candidatus Bathyarchaeia archaeon]
MTQFKPFDTNNNKKAGALAIKTYPMKNGRKVAIREALEEDFETVIQIWSAVASERKYILAEKITDLQRKWFIEIMGKKIGFCIVAEVEGKIVANCSLVPRGLVANKSRHVLDLGMQVLKEYRGLGIGNALMDYAIEWAREQGYEKISLSVFSTNKPAINLYKKFGFEIEGVKKKEFKIEGEYVDEVCMGKFLR